MIITVISYSVNRVTQRMLPCANYFSRELYTPFSGGTLRHMKKEEAPAPVRAKPAAACSILREWPILSAREKGNEKL